jgi:hypothetical protein
MTKAFSGQPSAVSQKRIEERLQNTESRRQNEGKRIQELAYRIQNGEKEHS